MNVVRMTIIAVGNYSLIYKNHTQSGGSIDICHEQSTFLPVVSRKQLGLSYCSSAEAHRAGVFLCFSWHDANACRFLMPPG